MTDNYSVLLKALLKSCLKKSSNVDLGIFNVKYFTKTLKGIKSGCISVDGIVIYEVKQPEESFNESRVISELIQQIFSEGIHVKAKLPF